MNLKEYLETNKISYRVFSEKTGIDHTALWRYSYKERKPTLEHALTIERVTGGMVSVFDLAHNGSLPLEEDLKSPGPSALSGVPS